MLKFGVIAEGPTDQIVIENILLGYFQDQEDEPAIHPIQPPRPLTETPGGWGHVFKSLERKDYAGALQYNDYLVIHIDTDVQEQPGFDVPRRDGERNSRFRSESIASSPDSNRTSTQSSTRPTRIAFYSQSRSIRSSAGSFRCSTMTKKRRRPRDALKRQAKRCDEPTRRHFLPEKTSSAPTTMRRAATASGRL